MQIFFIVYYFCNFQFSQWHAKSDMKDIHINFSFNFMPFYYD